MEAGLRYIMGRWWGCISEGNGGKECGLIFSVGFPKTRHVNSALNGEINSPFFFFFLLKRSLNYKSTIKKNIFCRYMEEETFC